MLPHGSQYFYLQIPTNKNSTFPEHGHFSMFHIKLKGIAKAAQWKHMFCPYTHPKPVGWTKS